MTSTAPRDFSGKRCHRPLVKTRDFCHKRALRKCIFQKNKKKNLLEESVGVELGCIISDFSNS